MYLTKRSKVEQATVTNLRLCWKEARPVVQGIFALRFCCAALLADHHTNGAVWPRVAGVLGCWVAATWAIYLLNGVADVVEDRENGSVRPVARGILPVDFAKSVVVGLSAAAIGFAALISPVVCLLVALHLAAGIAYSTGPRPLKGNVPGFFGAVVALGGLTYLCGWYASGATEIGAPLLLFGGAMSLWMGFGGATKDLSDVAGDRLAGRRTLPVVLGDRAARIAMAIGASAVGWGFLLTAVRWAPSVAPVSFVVCAGSVALAVVVSSNVSRGERFRRRRPYRTFMITQYTAHLTLLVSLIFQ
ncbi:UbiA family prenyltransferase [Lentzea aerocolonigenes]|uniref:UbiA family prenyltransferase n=1 Tax=Lentzea aerocolonigenes TaxID=68170 RepID=UPI00068E5CDB|nr:UbiA family prenyltransferase [Lentzea aerocolonigenes]MCP2241897.1 4-hydroxybenzoate polyprenyltransferase [Lentzea aerocolonigenes]